MSCTASIVEKKQVSIRIGRETGDLCGHLETSHHPDYMRARTYGFVATWVIKPRPVGLKLAEKTGESCLVSPKSSKTINSDSKSGA